MSSKDYIYCYQGKALRVAGSTAVIGLRDPYNPLGLPLYTMRLKFAQGANPSGASSYSLVDAEENIWDCTGNGSQTNRLPICAANTDLIEVISVNMRNDGGFHTGMATRFRNATNLVSVSMPCMDHVTDMSYMFYNCTSLRSVTLVEPSSCTNMSWMFYNCSSLTTVPLFDTSSCTTMTSMFNRCTSLTSVPLFDTSSCSDMEGMFYGCTDLTTVPLLDTSSCRKMIQMFEACFAVQSGALALYQQASTQATVPSHSYTFRFCGRDTVTGAAESAQIPTSWGGTDDSDVPAIIED